MMLWKPWLGETMGAERDCTGAQFPSWSRLEKHTHGLFIPGAILEAVGTGG